MYAFVRCSRANTLSSVETISLLTKCFAIFSRYISQCICGVVSDISDSLFRSACPVAGPAASPLQSANIQDFRCAPGSNWWGAVFATVLVRLRSTRPTIEAQPPSLFKLQGLLRAFAGHALSARDQAESVQVSTEAFSFPQYEIILTSSCLLVIGLRSNPLMATGCTTVL